MARREQETKEPKLSSQLPTSDRRELQAGDYAPDGLRGERPPLENTGSSPVAPSAKEVAAGGIPSAHPLNAYDAPDGDKTI